MLTESGVLQILGWAVCVALVLGLLRQIREIRRNGDGASDPEEARV